MAVSLALAAAVVTAACAGVTDRRAAARAVAAEADFPPEGDFVIVEGRRIHAVVEGTGPDVVLIHGAGGNTRDFTFDLVDRLSDRYRVIVFDRPGLGYSDRADDTLDRVWGTKGESPAAQAALLQAAAAQLGADAPVVVGHSYGGAVALAWALDHPDKIAAVVSLAGVAMPWPGELGAWYTVTGSALGGALLPPVIAAVATPRQIEAAIARVFAPDPVPDGYIAHFGAALTLRPDSLRANVRQVNTLYPHVAAMAPRYPGLRLPVEIVHGDRDTTVPIDVHSRPLASLVPGATLTVLDGVGHMPHHAAPEAVVAAIDRAAARAGLR